ncbi:hypothetical protein [Marinobacterium sedimentorum]|jgi:hypothetical protein|uniref:hypothetical protein n=1 Tax=Marinobacterium sedimentorum TaxID=2927804 RepID=UPI0020C6C4D5|nr:hypothetical protein [Marinobacterium sedimentorum]MCP8688357.1 hypothetical protein [Marinobacterium sedimentorum]
MVYLGILEQLLFWGGVILFLVSLGLYGLRTRDYRSLLMFWQPTIAFNANENRINRIALLMMILAVVLKGYLFYIS